MERKAQSWRLLESLQQRRILHGISQDVISPDTAINGSHWSTQSISGSPVPCHGEPGFRRVPSGESTSSSVFPVETIPTPRQERRLSSLRAASFDQASLNIPNPRSTPPLENHRVSFPFCTNNVKSSPVASHRPIWQRAQSLNTVCSSDVILGKKRESFQITLMDATTQTDFYDDHTPHLSLDEDTTDEITTDEEYSPIIKSPTTPISIVVSPSTNGDVKTHHRTKSLPKHLSIDENFDCQDSHHLSPTSPISPIPMSRDSLSKPTEEYISNCTNGVPMRHSSFDSQYQRINDDDSSSINLSSTLPSSFRFDNSLNHSSSTLSSFRSDSRFKLPLTKIHERDDEDFDDIPQEMSYKKEFTRGGNLRRSKSNFELSYKPRGLLKPPSPLTTHMHQSSEKLNKILSYSNERRYSPVFSPRVIFLNEEDDESDEIEESDNKKSEDSWLVNSKRWLEDIRKHGSTKEPKQTEEKKKSFWANKRIKSAGPSKNHKKGFFGLFRGRAMSMESIVDHNRQKKQSEAAEPNDTSNSNGHILSSSLEKTLDNETQVKETNLISKSPKISPKISRVSPMVSPMVSPQIKPRSISFSISETNKANVQSSSSPKGVFRRQSTLCSSPTETAQDRIEFYDTPAAKTVRNSLQLTPPTHRVIFLSSQKPQVQSISLPSSPEVNVNRHRSMKVFSCDQEPLHIS